MDSVVNYTQLCNKSLNLNVSSSSCARELPTNGDTEILGYYDSLIFLIVNRIALTTVLGMTGTASNVLNMCVFLKQGLHVTININFFAVAVVDLVKSINYLWMTVCVNPNIDTLDVPFVFGDILYLVNGWISASLSKVSIFITGFMTVHRYMSVLKPLTVKRMFTPLRTSVVLFFIFLLNGIIVIPLCLSFYMEYRFYPRKNRTMLGLVIRSNSEETQAMVFTIHAVLYDTSLTMVIIFTVLLIVQLNQQSRWRQNTMTKNQHQAISKKDKKLSKLVSLLAVLQNVFFFPTVLVSIFTAIRPDFSVSGKQANLFQAVWSFLFLFGTCGANVNVFIYYNMSSQYRKIFQSMLCFSRKV
ncbi:tachykinin-like peptides receptor 86C [Biomphalaria glabrata]|uniref:Tachykinin-like peptides receptor 86C n=1 Tax=Biomphalaria glabrata TaxID=6526 RepID=A0A9W2ZSY5_BIOGL|nr:tachykinin-like peptides receptor 86C [Biomphalaria glabrata]KAI8767032.1 melanopsin-like [Biomphalaria glabrata]